MKIKTSVLIICFYLLAIVLWANHFIPVYQGNGYNNMTIFISSATIDGINMEPGDEIGIFDEDLCVGAGVLTSEIPPIFQMVASADDPITGELDGFISGNPIIYRLWDSSAGIEKTNVVPTYQLGDSTFSQLGTAMVGLAWTNNPPTIVLPDYFTFAEDSTLVEDFAVYIDDVDPDSLTLSVSGNIEITVDIAGTIVTFGAAENWNGTEILIFTVDDNQTRATASDSVDVIVTPVNDPPTIVLPDYFTFAEDSTLVEDFAVYIDDVDPDELTLSVT